MSISTVLGQLWITQDTIVAANEHFTKLVTFDFKTQKWSDLVAGNFVNWAVSPDDRYLYFTTGGPEPKAERIRFADHQVEAITSLINLRRVGGSGREGDSNRCSAGWLSRVYSRHRHPRNLRAECSLALIRRCECRERRRNTNRQQSSPPFRLDHVHSAPRFLIASVPDGLSPNKK